MNKEVNYEYELQHHLNINNFAQDRAAHSFFKRELEIGVDQSGKTILDVGGGPQSILLDCFGFKKGVVLDPIDYPKHIPNLKNVYEASDIEFVQSTLEDFDTYERFDEVWCYNVLPHAVNAEKFFNSLINAVADEGIIRIMEPWNEPCEGHPLPVNESTFDYLKKYCDVIKSETINAKGHKRFTNNHYVNILKCNILKVSSMDYVRIHKTELIQAKNIAKYFVDLGVKTVADIGSGPGTYVHEFIKIGATGIGIDNNSQVEETDVIKNLDIFSEKYDETIPHSDLVICLEVAEHIDTSKSDELINRLTSKGDTILFSAAPPGQNGDGHINLKPKGFWIDKFKKRGFFPEPIDELLKTVDDDHRMFWFVQNAMLFKNKDAVRAPSPELTISESHLEPHIDPDKIKIHIYGLPHTITTRDDPRFMTCAFTTKVHLIAKKFHEMGHEVVHYGVEGSDVPCSENVEYIPFDLWDKTHGARAVETFHEHQHEMPTYQYAKDRLPQEINSRIKDPAREVVLASFGYWAHELKDIDQAALIEYGIGYGGTFSDYRCYESYGWQHVHHGRGNHVTDPKWFHSVIPGYVDPDEFTYRDGHDNYLLFVGRIIDTKGIFVAEQIAKKYGLKLVVAGNGNTDWIDKERAKTIEYVGVADVEQKRELFKNAKATMCMSHYTEPFGNVHIESMISGTPVITTDWGVYTETVPQGVTGWRGRTWEDHLYGMDHLDDIDPANCREWAMSNFTLDAVYPKFEQYFEKCAAHFSYPDRPKSWYFERDNYEDLTTNYQKNFEDYTKTHVVSVCNDRDFDKMLRAWQTFGLHNDNFDLSVIDIGLSEKNIETIKAMPKFRKVIKSELDSYYWAKTAYLKDIADSGKLLVLDADTYTQGNISEFLLFNTGTYMHIVDDAWDFEYLNNKNKGRTGNETYFNPAFTEKFPEWESYKNKVTLNAGIIAFNLNDKRGKDLVEEFAKLSFELESKMTGWPNEQGMINHYVYSNDLIDSGVVRVFDYIYNSSSYNTYPEQYKISKILHYHTEETLEKLLGD